jgi:predicted AlkP superfamily phosphohydrolase/phosphomutase
MVRVLVFGIDGGSYRIISKGIEAGRLPTFAKLMNEGASGTLKSSFPPITAPAWATCFTGKNPGKHGIFSFYSNEFNTLRPVSSGDIKSETFPEVLSRNGKKVGLVNLPLTYPIPKVNGFVVSGLLTPPGKPYTYPAELQQKLDEMNYKIEVDAHFPPGKEELYLDEILDTQRRRREGLYYLMQNMEWDVFAYFYRETDISSHTFWRFGDTKPGRATEGTPRLADAVLKVYEEADVTLSSMMKYVGSDTIVIVMSDHGFQGMDKMVHINNWLMRKGYASYKSGWRTSAKKFVYRSSPDRYYKLLMKSGFLFRSLFDHIREGTAGILSGNDIDWNKTFAYSKVGGVSPVLSLNLNEEMPDYVQLRANLAKDLAELKDEEGRSIVKKVWKREELYHGPLLNSAPGLVATFEDGYCAYPHLSSGGAIVTPSLPTQSGIHEMEGVLMALGPGVTNVGGLNADIMDLAPTILHILGVPIPSDMDGEVLRGMFSSSSPLYSRVDEIEPIAAVSGESEKPFTEQDEKRVLSHLKDLGYV